MVPTRLDNRDKNKVEIDPKYSDDINFIRSYYPETQQLKREIPAMLKENGLEVNTSKTEEYKVGLGINDNWKTCKILLSLLDTKDDITRRQGLATSACNKLEKAFKSRDITLKTKMRMFNGFVGSIFLYK